MRGISQGTTRLDTCEERMPVNLQLSGDSILTHVATSIWCGMRDCCPFLKTGTSILTFIFRKEKQSDRH